MPVDNPPGVGQLEAAGAALLEEVLDEVLLELVLDVSELLLLLDEELSLLFALEPELDDFDESRLSVR